MTILFTGRQADLTEGLKAFTEKKLAKLERFLDALQDAHVVLKAEKHRRLVEIVVKTRAATLTARGEAADFRDSIGLCADRLLAQAKRHHERLAKERKRAGMRSSPRVPETGAPPRAGDGDHPAVVRMGSIPAKPMSLEEALLQADRSSDPVLVFRNVESQNVAVLFRRADGRFGLVEEEV
jgi:putative sigma-54 modulation protein